MKKLQFTILFFLSLFALSSLLIPMNTSGEAPTGNRVTCYETTTSFQGQANTYSVYHCVDCCRQYCNEYSESDICTYTGECGSLSNID